MSPLRLAGAVALAALGVFCFGLHDGPFVDEYAYITQSYYSDLFFGGDVNDPAWLDTMAFDLQPLPKYFVGIGLRAANLPMPGPYIAKKWYTDAHTQFGPPETLTVARIPFIATGVIGCVALFGCGLLIGGRGIGAIGALLLAINPLYRLHAHRAMSDVPCEAFMTAALGLALWGCYWIWCGRGRWRNLAVFATAGVCLGLATLCKFNAFLGIMVVAAWCGLSMLVPRVRLSGKLGLAGGAIVMIATAAATYIALNPLLTARPTGRMNQDVASMARVGPWERFRVMIAYRLDSTANQQKIPKFQRDVVDSPGDKAAVLAVQGFGRFGPFGPAKADSVVRYDLSQDWGVALWAPLVLLGLFQTFQLGREQFRDGVPPTAFALLVWAVLAWAVVGSYIPLAWDRYFLPIQAPNALLAAVGACRLWELGRRKVVET